MLKRKGFVGIGDACEEPATARCASERRRAVPSCRRASVTAFAMVVVSTPLFVGSDGRRPIELGAVRSRRPFGRPRRGDTRRNSRRLGRVFDDGAGRPLPAFLIGRGTGSPPPRHRVRRPLDLAVASPRSAAPAPRGDHRQDLLRVKNPPRGNSYAAERIRLKIVFPGPYLRGVSAHCKSHASNHLKRLRFVHRRRSTSSTRG